MNQQQKNVLLLALMLDLFMGDPPNRWHPVAWMGSLISFVMRKRPFNNPKAEFGFGSALVLGGSVFVAGVSHLIFRVGYSQRLAQSKLPQSGLMLFEAYALKTTFSLRGLWRAADEVQEALERDDLPEARRLLSWHLVSRDTSALSASETAAATIESVAENSSDGVIAPLLAYVWGGLPLAMAYRFANTADAMLGYRDEAREWLGKFPARLDDIVNIIPARVSALLIAVASQITTGKGQQALQVMGRDAQTTDSPNAGFPMGAMAGGLGVELVKHDQYSLGAGLRVPQAEDIRAAKQILLLTVGLGALLLLLIPGRKQ